MKNAPWNTDHYEILLQKWRLAHDSAYKCEQFLNSLEVTGLESGPIQEESPEYPELCQKARRTLFAAGESMMESSLTLNDWKWFTENHLPEESDRWLIQVAEINQAGSLATLIQSGIVFFKSLSNAKQEFAKAIKFSLDAWQEPEPPSTSWYQRIEEGVRIHGKLVEVGGRNAEVLEFLCKRTSRLSTYRDIAELHKTWSKGLDSGNERAIKSAKSSIRTSLGKIRSALHIAFSLPDGTDPITAGKTFSGWKLDKDLLQTNSQ